MWEEKSKEIGRLQYGRGQQPGDSGSRIRALRAVRRVGSRVGRGWWAKMWAAACGMETGPEMVSLTEQRWEVARGQSKSSCKVEGGGRECCCFAFFDVLPFKEPLPCLASDLTGLITAGGVSKWSPEISSAFASFT